MLSQNKERTLANLKSGKGRARAGLVVVEGVRGAEEALAAGVPCRFAVTSPRLDGTPRGRALRSALLERRVEIVDVEARVLADLSHTETPQGVLLVVAEPSAGLRDLGDGPVLVLDGLQDPGNLGTLVRVAAGFGLAGVVALKGSVDPWNSKAVRASAGGVFRLPVVRSDVAEFLQWASERELPLLSAAPGGDDVARVDAGVRWGLVVGGEGAGVGPEVLAASRDTVAIPMPGGTESLNAAVAGSILLYALTRKADLV